MDTGIWIDPQVKPNGVQPVNILLVERDEGEVDKVKTGLRKIVNRIYWARNAEQALELVRRTGNRATEQRRVDLAMVDLDSVHESQAAELIDAIRSDGRTPPTPVIAMTYDTHPRTIRRVADMDVEWYMPKPISAATLARMVDDIEQLAMAVVRV